MLRRWTIRGKLTTRAPLHVGSGALTTHEDIRVSTGGPSATPGQLCDVQAVVRDSRSATSGRRIGLPCIPGTALKGVLRAWGERFFTSSDPRKRLVRIFGEREKDSPVAESGWAEFTTAFVKPTGNSSGKEKLFTEHVPYWCKERMTGIMSHVAIDPRTGAAARHLLFFQEFVPERVEFNVEIHAVRLDEDDIALLLAILQYGAKHSTHPYHFGSNGANGWGRMDWELEEKISLTELPATGLDANAKELPSPIELDWRQTFRLPEPNTKVPHLAVELTLAFQGPLLVDDKSRARTKAGVADPKKTNLTFLHRWDGTAWLPSSSLRGAIRARAEFLIRSFQSAQASYPQSSCPGDDSIMRLFGDTSRQSRLMITECEDGRSEGGTKSTATANARRQDFVAIDRFTGGAADGMKFDATFADRPILKSHLVLDLAGLKREDVALLIAAIRGVCDGTVSVGYGGSKGYGYAQGTVEISSVEGIEPTWSVPDSLKKGRIEQDGIAWFEAAMRAFLPVDLPTATAVTLSQPKLDASVGNPVATQKAAIAATNVLVFPGKLIVRIVKSGLQRCVTWKRSDGTWTTTPTPVPNEYEIAPDLRVLHVGEYDVDLELQGNRPARVRPRGSAWQASSSGARTAASTTSNAGSNRFIHPYYFARMVERTGAAFTGELGDQPATSREHIAIDRYTGHLRVELKTETPLLICDTLKESQSAQNPNGTGDQGQTHQTYRLRQQDNKPLLAASSVRGMLRAAFEAATNSRFGVFPGTLPAENTPATKHGRRLGYRSPAREALMLVPVRIEARDGELKARLLHGTSPLPGDSGSSDAPQFAAWLSAYSYAYPKWKPQGAENASHGDSVWVFLSQWRYRRTNEKGKETTFRFWNVEEIQLKSGADRPTHYPQRRRPGQTHWFPESWQVDIDLRGSGDGLPSEGWFQGYVCRTGRNINKKHDERVFFMPVKGETFASIDVDNLAQWRELIENYQDQHQKDIESGKICPPILRGRKVSPPYVYSRHITNDSMNADVTNAKRRCVDEIARQLKDGDLAYAQVKKGENGTWRVLSLYPVMISRRLFSASPLDLLPDSLRPAKTASQLSPADRVFGWVSQDDGDGAEMCPSYRGAVRLGPVEYTSKEITADNESRTIAILSQPKPHQGRFYLGDGKTGGRAFRDGERKEKEAAGYVLGNRIRGPKIYPHHREHRQELWQSADRSSQNRTIEGWVPKDATFAFKIDFMNLSEFELGALLWLLTLPEGHFLRLGLGKPLGFGSVRATVVWDDSVVADGKNWINSLATWKGKPVSLSRERITAMVGAFEKTMHEANRDLLPSLMAAAKGFEGGVVSYPRLPNQAVASEHYEWFEKNEADGRQRSLPDLSARDVTLE